MATKEDIKKARNKVLVSIAGAAVVLGGAIYGANKLLKKDAEKHKIENTILRNGPAYNNYKLSYKERRAALDEAVKNGEIKVVDKSGHDEYVDKQGNVVARVDNCGENQQETTFMSTVSMEYIINEGGIPIEVQEKGMAQREDRYRVVQNKIWFREVTLKGEKNNVRMQYNHKEELVETEIYDNLKDLHKRATPRDTYFFGNREGRYGQYHLNVNGIGIRDNFTHVTYEKNTYENGDYSTITTAMDAQNRVHVIRKVSYKQSENKGYEDITHFKYDDQNNLIAEEAVHVVNGGTVMREEKHYTNLETNYAHSITTYKKAEPVETVNKDAEGNVVRKMKHYTDSIISEISFKEDQKAIFQYFGDKLVGVRYENGAERREIEFRHPYKPKDQAVWGLARLAKEDISQITPENIVQKVCESYIREGDAPAENTCFYKPYKRLVRQNTITQIIKGNDR